MTFLAVAGEPNRIGIHDTIAVSVRAGVPGGERDGHVRVLPDKVVGVGAVASIVTGHSSSPGIGVNARPFIISKPLPLVVVESVGSTGQVG